MKSSPKRREKGNERRRQVLEAARKLLEEGPLDALALSDISKLTGIPLSSLYHFYPKILNVYSELMLAFGVELNTHLIQSLDTLVPRSWQELVEKTIDSCAEFYRINPAYQQLVLSGKAPAQIKSVDREGDAQLAQSLTLAMASFFELPRLPKSDDIFFNAVEIVDLFLSLDVMKNGHISSAGTEEAKRACISYLRIYLPDRLYQASSLKTRSK